MDDLKWMIETEMEDEMEMDEMDGGKRYVNNSTFTYQNLIQNFYFSIHAYY